MTVHTNIFDSDDKRKVEMLLLPYIIITVDQIMCTQKMAFHFR